MTARVFMRGGIGGIGQARAPAAGSAKHAHPGFAHGFAHGVANVPLSRTCVANVPSSTRTRASRTCVANVPSYSCFR